MPLSQGLSTSATKSLLTPGRSQGDRRSSDSGGSQSCNRSPASSNCSPTDNAGTESHGREESMHARIYSEFRKIVSELGPSGRILEIGAIPDASSLLAMPELSRATELVGINLAPASSYKNFAILSGNANHMPMFPDARFDCVLCN